MRFVSASLAFAAALSVALAAGNASANDLSIDNKAMKEVRSVNENGDVVTRRVEAETVVPGEQVIYVISYRNEAGTPAENVVFTAPIPEQMTYSDGTASGEGAKVVFSVDGGRSFGAWNQLFVTGADGTRRQAEAPDYTHLRFVLTSAVPAGGAGEVSYRAVLD